MNKTKKLLALILTAVMLICVLPLSAFAGDGGTTGNCTWSYSNGLLEITDGTVMGSYTSDTDVPWNTYKNSITQVTIGSQVTNIGENAFSKCYSLEYVYLENAGSLQTIEDSAFESCQKLESFNFGKNLIHIGAYAFADCTALGNIYIMGGVDTVAEFAFKGCTNIGYVSLEDGVKHIEQQAFFNCTALSQIYISRTLKTIGAFAFENCALTTATIPATIETISDWAIGSTDESGEDKPVAGFVLRGFSETQAKPYAEFHKITFEDVRSGVTGDCNYAFDEATATLTVSGNGYMGTPVTESPWNAFSDKIEKLIINEGVKNVGAFAFCRCSNLTSVELPSSLLSIDSSAFESTGISEINIPSGTTEIKDGAFENCASLEEISILNTVTTIGANAFAGCSNLKRAYLGKGVTNIGENAFFGTKFTAIVIPAQITSIGTRAFGYFWDEGLLSIEKVPNFKIIARKDTKGEAYAIANGFAWECDHEWGNAYIVKEAKCLEDGIVRQTCNYCSETKESPIPAGGHIWNSGVETVAPTCTDKGVKTFTCINCPETMVEEIPALTHSFAAGEQYCLNGCGTKNPDYKPHVHSYKKTVITPEDEGCGYTFYECTGCGHFYYGNCKPPVGKVSALKCSKRTAAAVALNWKAMGSWIEGYQVQCTNAAGNKWAAAKLTKANKYVFSGLGAGGSYKFRVRFYMRDPNGKAQFSKWATISVPTLPKATKLTSVASAKKAFTAKWAKTAGVTGYQLQYSTNAKFSGAKLKALKGAAKVSLKVSNLKGGAKYYVRVRTFKTIGGKNHFSAWSASKAVNTKK